MIAEKKKLTPTEQAAVDAFVAAAKGLPKSICIDFDSEGELLIQKRIEPGLAAQVAIVKKRSLAF